VSEDALFLGGPLHGLRHAVLDLPPTLHAVADGPVSPLGLAGPRLEVTYSLRHDPAGRPVYVSQDYEGPLAL
jgi:hypothetical protein